MKLPSARGVALGSVMFCVSCGPAPSPGVVTPPLVVGPLAPSAPLAAAKPEALPRPPDDLALLVRITDPQQLKREVVNLLPPSAASMAHELEPKDMLARFIGEPLTALVDLNQGIDVASVGGSDIALVFSLPVKPESEGSIEGVAERDEDGLALLPRAPDRPGNRGARELEACALTSSAGRTSTRLVCAPDEATLRRTAPYLARTVAAEASDADVKLTLPGRVLRDRTDRTASAMSDAASAQLGGHLVEDLLGEVDRIDGGLRFGGARIELAVDFRFTARTAMLTKIFVPKSVAAPPSPAFHRLPGDAFIALFTTGALADDIAPLRRALADTIEGTLVQDGYPAAKVRELREKIEGLFLTGGPLVFGAGIVGGREGAEKALTFLESSHTKPADEARAEAQARTAMKPWFMIEVEEGADRWVQGLRDIVRGAEDAEKARKPGSKASTPRDPDGDHVDIHLAAVDAALKLPKDSLHLEVSMVPRTKGSRPSRKGHLFVVPKGGATWIGYSEDVVAITARLRLAIDDTTEAGTIARSTDATALRSKPVLGAGIVSLVGVALMAASTTSNGGLRSAGRVASHTAGIGAKGADIVSWSATSDATPGAVRLSVNGRATRQTVVDVVRMLGL